MQSMAPIQTESAGRRQRDGGYLLLAILLMMALMIVAMTIAAPIVVQELKRDREEEMIQRGTQYARAIKRYYKKFGRYPTSLEQLDNTNQVRFLRRHYKDPLTKDGKWKLLSYTDVQTMLTNTGTAPGTPAAALGTLGQGQGGQTALQQALPVNPQSGGLTPGGMMGQQVIDPSQQLQSGGPQGFGGSGLGSQPGSNFNLGSDSGQTSGNSFSLGPGSPAGANQPGGGISGQNTADGSQTVGGAIVGVASVSKDPTIRIYNKKKKYDEWVFIYNPIMDQTNVLLRGPYQPPTIGASQVGTPAGQMNQQQSGFGQQQNGFGQQQNSFGQQNGFGQQPQQQQPQAPQQQQ